jgi:hypothetical protein
MSEPFERLVPEAINDFEKVAALAGARFSASQIEVEVRQMPHECPKTLPIGRMAVYSFFLNGQALKVGKAGPKTAARYTYQHYNPNSAGSTLAKSILTNPTRIGVVGIETGSIGD